MLDRETFNALNLLRTTESLQVDAFAEAMGVSARRANAILKKLATKKYVKAGGSITAVGMRALKPYKVDNAVIMAAGMSSRFAPLSYEKPKGVLVVKGEVLIERQIRQLQEAGIRDITVVVGYMKEKFFYLQDKFGVEIVVNEDYYRYNNTSTLIHVLPKLGNTYICSSDNYFTENVFEPYVYDAYYAATYFPGPANEWGIKTNRQGLITGINHAPVDMWCMMGHVYFSRAFSETFKKLLVEQYEKGATHEASDPARFRHQKKVWGDPVELPFENTTALAPSQSEEVLTVNYGDWRMLPPIENRMPSHQLLVS